MGEGYSYEENGPAPCRICGGKVYERLVPGPRMLSGKTEYDVKRTCQNPQCNSNTGDMSIADVV